MGFDVCVWVGWGGVGEGGEGKWEKGIKEESQREFPFYNLYADQSLPLCIHQCLTDLCSSKGYNTVVDNIPRLDVHGYNIF